MRETLKEIIVRNKDTISAIAAIVIFYLVLQLFGITCPIKFITGVSCPGCGMTRAWFSLLRFDISKAFYYHPLFFIPPFALIILMVKRKIKPSIYKALLYSIFIVFILTYIYRLIFGDGYVVSFNPQNSIFVKIYYLLFK